MVGVAVCMPLSLAYLKQSSEPTARTSTQLLTGAVQCMLEPHVFSQFVTERERLMISELETAKQEEEWSKETWVSSTVNENPLSKNVIHSS